MKTLDLEIASKVRRVPKNALGLLIATLALTAVAWAGVRLQNGTNWTTVPDDGSSSVDIDAGSLMIVVTVYSETGFFSYGLGWNDERGVYQSSNGSEVLEFTGCAGPPEYTWTVNSHVVETGHLQAAP